MIHRIVAFAIFALQTAPAFSQGPESYGLTDAQTNRVVSAMSSMFEECAALAPVYHPDCVSKSLQRGSSKISNNSGYWEANVALTRAARGLDQLVRTNTDANASRARAGGYRIKAVTEAALPGIRDAAVGILARAEQDLKGANRLEQRAFAPILRVILGERPWP